MKKSVFFKFIFLFSCFFITFFSSILFSATIYVSNTGSDSSGNGSISNPYLTISKALDESIDNDTISLREGTFNEAIRIRHANITIEAYQNENVVISTPINDSNLEVTVIFDVDADGGTLKNLEITGGFYYGVMLWTKWDWGDPLDRTGVSHITIDNCKIHNTGRDCIKITPSCDYVTIKNCEIYNSGTRDDGNAEGIDNVNGDFMLVQDCYIHDTATTGVYAKGGASDAIIERTIVENCGSLGISLGFDTSPEYFDLTVNPNRYENIRGTVKNCLVINTIYAGIAFYAALDSSAYNNTIVNTASTAHSPIYFGITLQDWEIDTDPNDGYNYRPASKNIKVYNNIVFQNSAHNSDMVYIRTLFEDELGRVNAYEGLPDMNNNCYYSEGNSPTFTDQRPDSNAENMTFLQWQAHISGESNTIAVNPQLDNIWKPQSNSPCINKGDSSLGITKDLENNNRDSQIDMGAYEYLTGENPPVDEDFYYIPHIAHNNYTTYLNIYSPNNESISYSVYLNNENGTLIQKSSYTTAPYSTKLIDISSMSGGNGTSGKIGITSGNAIIKVVYFNTDGGMAEYLAENTTSSKLTYTFPSYNDEITWNGLACLNTSNNDISITLKVYFEGINTKTETMTLGALKNIVDLVGDGGNLFSELGHHDVDMIEITTSSNVLCGLNISGAYQEKLLFSKAIQQ